MSQLSASSSKLLELSAVEAIAAMRRGELQAERYAEALLAQAKRWAHLNAFITLDAERVLETARAADKKRASNKSLGVLHGLPIPIKDSINTADLPTTAGTPVLRGFRPHVDAPLVALLRNAGAVVLGKTNLHELSFGWTSNNLAFGAVHNPYDATRTPGGSTGGTAAAIAARIAPLGIAEDTQGSIRVPAALCGIVGFRPTIGRYSTEGAVPITPVFDQVGPHARCVSDIVLFDDVVTEAAAPIAVVDLTGVRLGVDPTFFEGVDPTVERVTKAALARLKDAGVVLVEAPVPRLRELVSLTTGPIQVHDVVPSLRHYLHRFAPHLSYEELIGGASSDIRATFSSFAAPGSRYYVDDDAYRSAHDVHRPALQAAYRQWFADHRVEAMVFPTTRIAATTIGEAMTEIRGVPVSFNEAVSRNIASGSTAGLPGLVLPSGLTEGGLPVSLELDGPADSDRRLLALALAVERLFGALPPPALRV